MPVKIVLGLVALGLSVALSLLLALVAFLAFFVSLIAVVFQAFRRRPSRAWGIAVLSSFVLMLAFSGISNAVYSPASSPPKATQEAAAKSEDKAEPQSKESDQAAAKPTLEPEPKPKPEAKQKEHKENLASRFAAMATVSRVVDGDTIEVSPAIDGLEEVRLIGVDTPETKDTDEGVEPYGPEASAFATDELTGRRVGLQFDVERIDQCDRLLAYVYVGREIFNEELVET